MSGKRGLKSPRCIEKESPKMPHMFSDLKLALENMVMSLQVPQNVEYFLSS
jgi:hypothetical protein